MTAAARPVGTLARVDLTTPFLAAAADLCSGLPGWEVEFADTPVGGHVTCSAPGPFAPRAASVPPSCSDRPGSRTRDASPWSPARPVR
ncbi:hypothetical protein [Blastococcus sp. URHD0036]|uniref:hypothetical protein n=1 Tax=Blastococcus sp. URHD0036 TaxID=1380356 RepID=UPI000496F8B7|nr:hypothetical protein [Blastococcus sp. URHD0036]